ncbi:MAG: hypothetical protein A3F83_14205 [Candidatus Glassbacteria bacterium RIFCSPLOWO2_12_FULL_58_11]|uniref:Uncharacterized protein n=1 Tax=Candidatus Glassbacteria bacterium RIFCSPLOWO2_12_FULL_58_11 TaxID=1817867 RepID=A0A1F5YM67_9BACT|nr:MAG: hypothetical protein A3F83_14205 [Candidatus Glassbacteria bacterium RIFCSPLOWO2_12_FULL_58_11]
MNDKVFLLDEYFKSWDRDVTKAAELLGNQRYHLEGILVLSCYLSAFAAMRFPDLRDREAYINIVNDYSGKRDFYEKIDLLFLYQWPQSKLCDNGRYKKLKNYSEIVAALKKTYGGENDVKAGIRYVSPKDIIFHVLTAAIPGFDEQNFRDKLSLFSLAELLYRYVRCDAVHNADFPFVNKSRDTDGNISYKYNHAITGQVLLATTQSVCKALWEECRTKSKWTQQL